MSGSGVDTVVIDRTPFTTRATDLPTVQEVPAEIYPASYPAWLLSRERLLGDAHGVGARRRVPQHRAGAGHESGVPFTWDGMLLVRDQS